MTSTNIDIARAYFQAVQTGDMAVLGELLDEAIVWHQPGANQFSGWGGNDFTDRGLFYMHR